MLGKSHQLIYNLTMKVRITSGELTGLHPKHAAFVIEYLKDFHAGDAAERIGYSLSSGHEWINRPDVQDMLTKVLSERMEKVGIDAEWVLMELVDNHILARQKGMLTASNTALRIICQHASVDAFAAEKVLIAGDDEIRERLLRGRRRREEEIEEVEEVTFY